MCIRDRVKARRGYRTPRSVLRELGSQEMYFYLGRKRDDVLSVFPLDNLGLHVSRMLADRFGSERERGVAVCVEEASRKLGVASMREFSKDEREAWRRWSPLICVLPGVEEWSRSDKEALAAVIAAKGSRYELDYLRGFDQHTRLRDALSELAYTPID